MGSSPLWVKPKTIKLVFAASPLTKHVALRSKNKLSLNQYNLSEWSNMSTGGLLYQWVSTIKIQLSMLWLHNTKQTSSLSHRYVTSRHDMAEKLLTWC